MIARHWRGLVRADQAAAYEQHLRRDTVPILEKIEGFVEASMLRRVTEAGIEYLVITRWMSIEAIEQFAGSDVEAAVVPAEVQAMMVEYDRRARHYEVV